MAVAGHCYAHTSCLVMSGHVIHLQDDQTLPNELKCAYCELVLNDPMETSESELRFCAKCHDKASK